MSGRGEHKSNVTVAVPPLLRSPPPGEPGGWRLCKGLSAGLATIGSATALAFAGILCLATVIAGLTATLPFTLILPFAGMFAFCVIHLLERDAGFAISGRCCRIRAHGERPG